MALLLFNSRLTILPPCTTLLSQFDSKTKPLLYGWSFVIRTGMTGRAKKGTERTLDEKECESLIRALGGNVVNVDDPKIGETEWMKKGVGKRVVLVDDLIDDQEVVAVVETLMEGEKIHITDESVFSYITAKDPIKKEVRMDEEECMRMRPLTPSTYPPLRRSRYNTTFSARCGLLTLFRAAGSPL